jgi:hypothetical protein
MYLKASIVMVKPTIVTMKITTTLADVQSFFKCLNAFLMGAEFVVNT